jgi:ABC-type antimicrobial peptide transport system permease subunit
LRREVPAAQPAIRVANIVTQEELVRTQMIRERLLATLSLFFAAVALILAAVGLYGVLNYAVLERRRELGIRIALGASSGDIGWRVTLPAFAMIGVGSAIGLGLGLASEGCIAAMLYQVKATDPNMLALPLITMLGAAVLAALPPVLRAVRIDPAALLRSE